MKQNTRRTIDPARPSTWRHLDDSNGIAHNCNCITQDALGRIWIGTWLSGLSCFDGREVRRYTIDDGLPDNRITTLAGDTEGNVWIGTSGSGLACFDGHSFLTFEPGSGVDSGHISALCAGSDGDVWIAVGNRGLIHYSDGAFTEIGGPQGSTDTAIRGICAARDGGVWIAKVGIGPVRFDGNTFIQGGISEELKWPDVWGIAEDSEGSVWCGSWNDGVICFDGRVCRHFTSRDGLADNRVHCIARDREGIMWFGTGRAGALYFDGEDFGVIDAAAGLCGNDVADLLVDTEGGVWFACNHGGVSRLDPYSVEILTVDNVEEAAAIDTSGRIWYGTDNRLCAYDGESRVRAEMRGRIQALHVDGAGRLWVGTNTGLIKYESPDDVDATAVPEALPGTEDHDVWSIEESARGVIWVGTSATLLIVNQGAGRARRHTFAGHSGGAEHIEVEYDDKLWISSVNPPCILHAEGEEILETLDLSAVGATLGEAIRRDSDGNIWFGTDAGLATRKDGALRLFGPDDGLVGTYVKTLLLDRHGHLWTGSLGGGLSRFDGHVFHPLTAEDGLPGNSAATILDESDDSILIAGYGGICRYYSDRQFAPVVQVLAVDHAAWDEQGVARIDTNIEQLTIHFRGISMKTRQLRYSYRLEGYDEDWCATTREYAVYSGLEPGRYVFHVYAVSRDLGYSEKTAAVTIEVSADPRDERLDELEEVVEERTRELRATNMQLSEALTRIKEAEQQVIQSERMIALGQIASGVAHDFNNALMPLVGLTEMMLSDPRILESPEEARSMLSDIQDSAVNASNIVRRLRDFYRPMADEDFASTDINELVEDVVNGMRHRLTEQQVETRANITLETALGSAVSPIVANRPQLHSAITNIVLNAFDAIEGDGVIRIETDTSPSHLRIRISDTGVGMTEEECRRCVEPFFTTKGGHGTGIGLAVVYGIVQGHGGTLDVSSESGHGTTFAITLPVGSPAPDVVEVVPDQPTLAAQRILAIDDDPWSLDVLTRYLKADGHEVTRAASGNEGLQISEEREFDLVITDRAMPDLSGDQVAEAIALRESAPPVLMVTGFGDIMGEQHLLPPGVEAVLGKPLSRARLRSALADAVNGDSPPSTE